MALIVVVDDDIMIRTTLREVLERNGHTVLEAAEGDGCFKHFETARPELVITDIFMPGKGGLETVFELNQRWPEVRVIAMSVGHPGEHDLLKLSKTFGADRILPKPFNTKQVLTMVNELLATEKLAEQTSSA